MISAQANPPQTDFAYLLINFHMLSRRINNSGMIPGKGRGCAWGGGGEGDMDKVLPPCLQHWILGDAATANTFGQSLSSLGGVWFGREIQPPLETPPPLPQAQLKSRKRPTWHFIFPSD